MIYGKWSKVKKTNRLFAGSARTGNGGRRNRHGRNRRGHAETRHYELCRPSQGGRLVYDLEKIRVGHLTLPLKTKNIFKMRKNADKLAQFIRENGINIVHARSRSTGLERLLGGKESRRPLHDHVSRHLRTRPLGTEKAL